MLSGFSTTDNKLMMQFYVTFSILFKHVIDSFSLPSFDFIYFFVAFNVYILKCYQSYTLVRNDDVNGIETW